MRDKFPIIKNRDRCDYWFDTHKWIDLTGADYLSANDDFLMIFFWTDVIAKGYDAMRKNRKRFKNLSGQDQYQVRHFKVGR